MDKPDTSRRPRREDFQQALRSMDTYIDVTVDDLMALAERAEQIASRNATESLGITKVMSQPVRTVQASTSLAEAAHLMVTERVSGLPVVDGDGHLVGIITEADFLRALGVPAHQPHHSLWQTLESLFSHLARHGEIDAPDDQIADHMVRDVVCASPDQDLHHVIELMKRHKVKRVVVCDDERRVLGIVTRSDLVRIFFDRYTQPRQR